MIVVPFADWSINQHRLDHHQHYGMNQWLLSFHCSSHVRPRRVGPCPHQVYCCIMWSHPISIRGHCSSRYPSSLLSPLFIRQASQVSISACPQADCWFRLSAIPLLRHNCSITLSAYSIIINHVCSFLFLLRCINYRRLLLRYDFVIITTHHL